MINNLYIEKVRNHEKILTDLEEIYSHKGRWGDFFGNKDEIRLEIGTGLGNFFSKSVLDNYGTNFIGIELRYKRLYKTAEKALGNIKNNDNSEGISNRDKINPNFVVIKDYGENINKIFDKNEIDLTYIFFPDPWDKKVRWLKKRLLQKEFLDNLYKITKKGGSLIFKTDNKGYFDFVLEEIKKTKWKLHFSTYDYEKDGLYDQNSITEFEQIFRGQDLKVCYMEVGR